VLYDDGHWEYVNDQATPTPADTAVPYWTKTPVPMASPTRENTPQPTISSTSIPVDRTCYAGVISNGLNVRADHDIGATRVATLEHAARVPALAVYVVKPEGDVLREEWAHIAAGWIALWYRGDQYAILDDTDFCWSVPISYEISPIPTPPATEPAAWLIHTVPSVQKDALYNSYPVLQNAGLR